MGRRLIPAVLLLLWTMFCVIEGRIKRCYVCHSRGERGDCKDPFTINSTTVEKLKAVEDAPCASGWCAKVVKGSKLEVDTMTERLCLQRPPSDGEERCAKTQYDHRKVYMCFCQGDLCNGVTRNLAHPLLLVLGLLPLLRCL